MMMRGLPWLLLLSGCSTTPPRSVEPPAAPAISANHTSEPAAITADQSQPSPDTAPVPDVADATHAPSSSASAATEESLGEEIAVRAIALVGKPYRYGGADLHGFDCSGLVYYIYHELGIEVPRSAADQHRSAEPVTRDDMQPGDLVFFRIRHRISHVGIYVGDNRFVHAPRPGKHIELRTLDEKYFVHHWADAGRLLP